MRQSRNTLLCLPFATLLFFAACGGDDDDATPSSTGGAPSHAGEGQGGVDAHGGDAQGGDGHGVGPAVCEVLGTLCHAADSGTGPVSECHDVGHEGNEAACEAQFALCITTCAADEGGSGGSPSQVVSDPYCEAMGELCHFLNDEGTPTGECHEIGHVGNEADCIDAFAECAPMCLAKRELEPDGHEEAGGAGGGAHSDLGGHDEGGTGGHAHQ